MSAERDSESSPSGGGGVDDVENSHQCIVCLDRFDTVQALEGHVMGCARRAATAFAPATPEPNELSPPPPQAEVEKTPPAEVNHVLAYTEEAPADPPGAAKSVSNAPSEVSAGGEDGGPLGGGTMPSAAPLAYSHSDGGYQSHRTETPPSEPDLGPAAVRSGSLEGSPNGKASRRARANLSSGATSSTLHDVLQSLEEMQIANKERMSRAGGATGTAAPTSLDVSRDSSHGGGGRGGRLLPQVDEGDAFDRSHSVSFTPSLLTAATSSKAQPSSSTGTLRTTSIGYSPPRSSSVGPPTRGTVSAPSAPVLHRRAPQAQPQQVSHTEATSSSRARIAGTSSPPPRRSVEEPTGKPRRTATVHPGAASPSSPSNSRRSAASGPMPRTSSVGPGTARSRNVTSAQSTTTRAKQPAASAGRPSTATLAKPLVASNGLSALHRAAPRLPHDVLAASATLRRVNAVPAPSASQPPSGGSFRQSLVPPPPLTSHHAMAAAAGKRLAGLSPERDRAVLVRTMTANASPSSTSGSRVLYCTECGRRHLAETAKFCAFCGHRRERPATAL